MRKPYWREQSRSWVVKLASGTVKTLGKDENGAGKEHPPKHIVEKWHALIVKTGGSKPGEEHKPKDMRLQELADAYLEALTHEKTRAETKWQLDTFIAYMGNVKVSQIEVHQVLAYLNSKTTWASTSKATALERITSAINWAIGVQRLDKECRLEVPKSLKPRRKKRKAIIKPEVQAKMEEKATPALRAMLKALRLSGARPGELCGALIEKCDLKKGILLVLNKTRNKTEVEYRPLYLSKEMIEHLRLQIGKRKTGRIFLKDKGTAWQPKYLGHMIWKLRKRLKLPDDVVAYAVRHTFASNAINRGDVNVILIAQQLGHTDLQMLVKHYFHEDPAAMLEAVQKMSQNKHSETSETES